MLGMLGGIAEASEGRHELVFFAPTGPPEHSECGRRSTGFRAKGRSSSSRRRRTSGEVLEPTAARAGRAVRGPAGRFPLLGLDVSPAAGRSADDHGPRPRPDPPPRVGRSSDTGAPRPEGAPCRRRATSLRELATPPTTSFGPSACRRSVSLPTGDPRATAWAAAEYLAPYLFTTATSEPRKNLRRLLDARAGAGTAPRTGTSSLARRIPSRPTVQFLGYVDAECRRRSTRAGGVRLPIALRGLRDPGGGGDGVGHLTVVSTHSSLDEASGDAAIRVEPASPGDRVRHRDRTHGRAALVPHGLAHAQKFTWRACGEAMLRGYESARD